MTKIPEFGPSGGGHESAEGFFWNIERGLVTYIFFVFSQRLFSALSLVHHMLYELSYIYTWKRKQRVRQLRDESRAGEDFLSKLKGQRENHAPRAATIIKQTV